MPVVPIAANYLLKACPRCHGDLAREVDYWEDPVLDLFNFVCLQCGFRSQCGRDGTNQGLPPVKVAVSGTRPQKHYSQTLVRS